MSSGATGGRGNVVVVVVVGGGTLASAYCHTPARAIAGTRASTTSIADRERSTGSAHRGPSTAGLATAGNELSPFTRSTQSGRYSL